MIQVVQMGKIGVIMRSERFMSSVGEVDSRQVSIQLHGEQGGEIGLPKCDHFHVARCTLGYAVALSRPKRGKRRVFERCKPVFMD